MAVPLGIKHNTKLTEQEEQDMLEGQKTSEEYFAKWDAMKASKATQL
jgi:hypothetical protein